MQERVTGKIYRKRGKKFLPIILVMFFLCFLIVLLAVAFSRRENCFSEKSYYFVYVLKSNTKKIVTNESDNLKSIGGAGFVLEHLDEYYLITSMYSEKSSAEEVLSSVKAKYNAADILKLSSKKIKGTTKSAIKQNITAYELFKWLDSSIVDLESISMNYLSGKSTDSSLLVKILEMKLEISKKLENFSDEGEIFDNLRSHLGIVAVYLDNFLRDFATSSKKESMVCLLPVQICLIKIELASKL